MLSYTCAHMRTATIAVALCALLLVACSSDNSPGLPIAFNSDRDGNAEIYVMNADGSNQTNLTNNPADDSLPSWSPVP